MIDRRSFLKSGAACGMAFSVASRGVAFSSGDDPLGIRKDFPVTEKMTYINCAYVGPMPRVVHEAALQYAEEQLLNPAIGLDISMERKESARRKFAELFGAKSEEVALLFSTSDAENIVTRALDLKPGDNVVIDELHFITTFVLYRELEKTNGIELRIVPHRDGRAPVDDFEARVDRRTRLISVAWVSNRNGYRHHLPSLAELAHRNGGYLFADGIQALGCFPADLHEEGADFVGGNSYKWLLASWGAAPFYVREEHLALIRPDRFGHNQVAEDLPDFRFRLHETAKKYEYAGLNYGAVAQLEASLGYLSDVGLSRVEGHTVALARELRDGVAKLGYEMFTPPDNPSAIVSFVHGRDPKLVKQALHDEKISVTLRENDTQIRASVGLFNNRSDIVHLLEMLAKMT
ncbi:MAG TPA: aminotransferase class V-fold PLP-dependent enzyme [Vicinamibacteria bacterium]|nr:aminotransferase class V-fold PLP-dependent enzyme [Vicinamibacteria bacterium]